MTMWFSTVKKYVNFHECYLVLQNKFYWTKKQKNKKKQENRHDGKVDNIYYLKMLSQAWKCYHYHLSTRKCYKAKSCQNKVEEIF